MGRFRTGRLVWIATVLLGVLVGPVLAQGYTVTDLGILPGKKNTILFGIQVMNNAGDIAGFCNDGGTGPSSLVGDYFSGGVPFVWTKKGGLQALPMPLGAANAIGWNVNDRGQVTGAMFGSDFIDAQVLVWERGMIQTLGYLSGDNSVFLEVINNRGDVLGASVTYAPDGFTVVSVQPVLWRDGQIHPLPTGGFNVQAIAMNNRGQIGGFLFTGAVADAYHTLPLLWDKDGGLTVLGTLGGECSSPWVMNDAGTLAGFASTPLGEVRPVIWEKGVPRDLGSLGGGYGEVWAINNRGQAVGDSLLPSGVFHATLYENGSITDLNDLIAAGSGWELLWAVGINERGEIAGTGLHNGEIRSYLLTPKK